jgi:hypothetical protein
MFKLLTKSLKNIFIAFSRQLTFQFFSTRDEILYAVFLAFTLLCLLIKLLALFVASQAFNVLATPIRQAQAANYRPDCRVLDINHIDVSC